MSAKARKVPQRNPAAAQLIHYNSTSPIYAGVAFKNDNNPTWLTDLARVVPEASWWKTTSSNDPVLNPRHPDIETGFKEFEKLPSGQQHVPKSIIQNQQPLSPLAASCPSLVRKVQNWKEWHTQMAAAISTLEIK
eukprot:855314-Pelagomonas_calceolata.AAC.1